jgi:hypothetical protein
MKKLYSLISSIVLFTGAANAQLTLTQSFNEPVIGNVDVRKDYDSTAALPKTTGTGQVWNFSTALASTTNAPVANTYTTPSSVPGGSTYPTATIAQDNGTFFKSSTNMFEMLGIESSTMALTFTNTAIISNWPIAYNYSNTDPVAGNINMSAAAGTFSGTINTMASGSGTLILPNALTFTNSLMVVSRMLLDVNITSPFPTTATLSLINYQYFHSSQKFPVVSIVYTELQSSVFPFNDAAITLNNNIFAGINELNFDHSYSVYPNPATGSFHVVLDNPGSENATVEICDMTGRILRKHDLGNGEINTVLDISGFNTGVYSVKTILGKRSSVKKLIVE